MTVNHLTSSYLRPVFDSSYLTSDTDSRRPQETGDRAVGAVGDSRRSSSRSSRRLRQQETAGDRAAGAVGGSDSRIHVAGEPTDERYYAVAYSNKLDQRRTLSQRSAVVPTPVNIMFLNTIIIHYLYYKYLYSTYAILYIYYIQNQD